MTQEKAMLAPPAPRNYPHTPRRPFAALLAIALAASLSASILAVSGCGSGITPGLAGELGSPVSALRVNQTVQLQTNSAITGSPMVFSVNGIVGGNAIVGTVDGNGVYTAPAIVPSPSNTVTITTYATLFPNDPHGSVTINVLNPVPIATSATPGSFAEGTELVTVSGSQFVYGAQLYWNGVAIPTTYISSTQLAASITAPNPGTYNLAVMNPDPGAASSNALPENVVHGQVTLTINPNSGTTVRVNNRLYLGTTVNGTSNTAVTWSINGSATGNSTIGTIAPNADGSVNYTAPAVVPTPGNVVTLTATSVDSPSVSASQPISVLNPIPILNSATPSAFDPGTATVTLNGSAFIQGAQVLVNGSPVPTTFNSGGQLTATLNLPDPGDLDLQVLNPAPGPARSNDLIALVKGTPPTLPVSATDASRFLEQATFGATDPEVHNLSKIGYTAWFQQQFNTPIAPIEPLVEQQILVSAPPCTLGTALACNRNLFLQNADAQTYVSDTFWQQAMTGNDQLRQRVQYTLSEIFVASSSNPSINYLPRGIANYYDVLGQDAFGNFRQLLEDVTLNPMMGIFLSVQGNDKGDATRDPDENYAREVMQLFTIGLYQLNPDGTQVLDATGKPIPTYSNTDVMGLAKVFTGFSWNIPGDTSDHAWYNCCDYVGPGFGEDILPMQSYPSHHSTDSKTFLGVTIPASSTPDPRGDLKIALDTLFNHPNAAPFFSKQIIQHLVTSNPSPAYVARVASVFADNGYGVRGDMKAILQAVLLDPEARDAAAAAQNSQFGKVRESLVRYTEWSRAFSAQSRNGGFRIGSTGDPVYGLGEMALQSPTVFNWFAPGYTPPATTISQANLVAPEMQMTNVSTVTGYLNFMESAIGSTPRNGSDVFSSYSTETALAATPDALLDRINLLLMAGSMDPTLRGQILAAVNSIAIPSGDQNAINAALTERVQVAIFLTIASPSFSAQN
jgi:uncharacterized protein (DUF1800 family)